MDKSPILGLRTCIYVVTNLEEAIKWYTVAFKKEPYFNESYYVGFDIGGYELGLQPSDLAASKKTESVFTYWGVENIMEQYDQFIAIGAEEHEKPNNVGGELMVATVKDPWGNIIGLIYNPYFK